MRISRKKYQALAVAIASSALLGSTAYAADAQNAVERTVSQDQARAALDSAQRSDFTAQAVKVDRITVAVTAVDVKESTSLKRDAVLALVPELKKSKVNIHELSKEIQLVNDTGAAKLNAKFVSNHDGTFTVVVSNEAQKNDRFGLSVSNNGNEYTGDWRATLSYVNNNISRRADSLGLAYVTSPDKHFSDVRQFAASYRTLLPELGGALIVNASYSDIDLGNIAPSAWSGLLDYTAAGKGTNVGVHYQQYIAYTSREKDIVDLGLDYKRSRTDTSIGLVGTTSTIDIDRDYSILLGSIDFIHNDRSGHHAFTYDLGFSANAHGDKASYNAAAPGSDDKFMFVKAGASYQVKSKSDWILGARVNGQYTTDHLVTLAQLGAGGASSVRGFNSNAVTADKGVVGSLEIYTPEIAKGSRFLAFFDYGNLANNKNSSTTCFGNESIASAGLGYRYADRTNGWFASLDWAKIVDDIDTSYIGGHQRKPWQVTVTKSF